jgi:IPT/TIG domain
MDLARQLALYGSDQAISPPDTQLAAGTTYLVEATNSSLSIWTKSGSLVGSADLNVFFSEPTGYRFTDPRILYDTESTRWFLSGLAFTATNDSQIYIAVSATSDPTGSWNVFLIANGAGVLGDQPMIGVNSDKVVISWNDFTGTSPTTSTFSGQETWVLQKSELVSGASVHSVTFGPDVLRFRVVPAQSLTPTTSEWLSYENSDCSTGCNTGSPTVGVVEIAGTPNSSNVMWIEHDPSVQATTMPPNPRQPSGIPVTQQIDEGFLSAVWQRGMLWVSGTNGCIPGGDSTTRSCMRLIAISTGGTTPTVTQDLDAAQFGVDLYYPAVTLNNSGDLFIGYSASSSTLNPSALAEDSLAASPMTLENPITLGAGLNSYVLGTSNRWGDYSAAAPDPSNPADVWLTAEYQASATDQGNWGTATGQVAIQPSISTVSPSSGSVSGGTSVTIAGDHFESGAAVSFGSSAGTNVNVVSSTVVTATTPAAAATGPVNVAVNNPDGTAVTAPSAYTYTPAAPTVSSLAPDIGPPAGATAVMVTGTNFTAVTAVAFGSAGATAYTVNSATQIAAISPPGSGTVDVTVTTAAGTSAISVADRFTFVPGSGVYTAITPTRLLDTRGNGGTLRAGASVDLVIGGVPANATAVILNVTAVDESTSGFFTVFPTGGAVPTASNLNWVAGKTVPNLVSVGLGTGGAVTIYNGLGTADAIVDLEGYFAPSSAGSAGQFVPVVPARIADTRAGSGQPNGGSTLRAGTTLDVQVTGAGGVPPTGVTAVVLNTTATDTTSAGFITVFPKGATLPVASNLNWTAGVTVPNRVIVPVGTGGMVSFYNGLGSADLVVDVNGYFTDNSDTGVSFVPLSPARLVDTRNGLGPLGPAATMVVTVAGNGGVPTTGSATPPKAVVLNVTVANPNAASDLVAWPVGTSQPLASDLNFVAGQTVPNLVVVELSAAGQIDIFNAFGSTNVIVDVVGWYG